MEMECLDFRFYYKKMMSLESSRVNVGNIYLLLTVCVILYIGRMLFKNKTETKSFETNETFDDIKIITIWRTVQLGIRHYQMHIAP